MYTFCSCAQVQICNLRASSLAVLAAALYKANQRSHCLVNVGAGGSKKKSQLQLNATLSRDNPGGYCVGLAVSISVRRGAMAVVFFPEVHMKNKVLGLALGASLLFGLQQLAVAAPVTVPGSAAEMSFGQMSAAEPIYYARRTTVVGHGCAGGRRCVGGYYHGVCRTCAACR